MIHQSVLLHESIEGLNLHSGDVFVDATLNGGGHSQEVAKKYGNNIHIIGIDLDADAIGRATERLKDVKVNLVQENFRNVDKVLDQVGVTSINAILFDLGLSSNQIEESGRGFSFKTTEPLLMTMKKNPTPEDVTAYEVVNNWQESSLIDILRGYGEESFAPRIARAIIAARELKPIETAEELAQIVTDATPMWYRFKRIHPATKTFQAIRIAVNDELQALKEALTKSFDRLAPKGRMSIISFHSLEDRIVKRFYKQMELEGKATLITKKPIIPTEEEILNNPRSRSAKLRILEKK
jgi:16S rRNA (cytosine1402-N4)-methyltransferase